MLKQYQNISKIVILLCLAAMVSHQQEIVQFSISNLFTSQLSSYTFTILFDVK